jgi:acyl carrier protein
MSACQARQIWKPSAFVVDPVWKLKTKSKHMENIIDTLTTEQAAALVQEWMQQYVGELLEIQPDEIDLDMPFNRYGLDSSAAVGLTGDLGTWIGVDVDAASAYDYPTIRQLSQAVVTDKNNSLRVLSNLAARRDQLKV